MSLSGCVDPRSFHRPWNTRRMLQGVGVRSTDALAAAAALRKTACLLGVSTSNHQHQPSRRDHR